ncbi:MAG TPA: acyl carrier protein [Bacteroidia bacterium]|jgi:acyl carrier protein|nr:acyl carrier protein [Bacteroidia bacterium]
MSNSTLLYKAFAEALNIDPEKVNDELRFQSIPEWDSISHMVLISVLEETFGISMETDDVIDLSSVSKAREILTKYKVVF